MTMITTSKITPIAALLGMLALSTVSSAQAQVRQSEMSSFYQRPDTMHGKTVLIPAGTTFEGRIDTTISSRGRTGQSFSIILASPLIANGVDVIIPAGAQVLGEVVEAIPSGDLPRKKGQPKPVGKLRVQLTTLKMPDGMTYPLVGSIAGETIGTAKHAKSNPQLGGGVAFMGSQSSFAQVAPHALNRLRNYGSSGAVMGKAELLRHPLYGRDQEHQNSSGREIIRSLVRKGNNLYIFAGSPLTVHLDAPFKLGVPSAPVGTALLAPTFGQAELESGARSKRRFARTGNTPNNNGAIKNVPSTSVPLSPQRNPLPGILPDKPSSAQAGASELTPAKGAPEPNPF